jgi:sulfide dehydrogenase cytochrome subunit
MMSQQVHAVNSDAEAITHGCAGCHGTEGYGYGSLPPVNGMDRQLFLEAMRSFKQGDRQATVMNRIAKGFSDTDLVKLADHFSRKP